MPDAKPNPLIEQVASLLDQAGVQNYMVVIENPDAPGDTWSVKGSISWAVGAMEVCKHTILNKWEKEE